MKEKKWYLGSENKKQRGKGKNKKIDPRKNKETTSNAVCKNETSKMMSFSEYKKLVGVHKFSKTIPKRIINLSWKFVQNTNVFMTRQSQLRKDKFMTDNSKERKTIVPPTETLTALIADLTITAPQLNTESEKIDSYWRGLNAAYKFQNKNQITSALVIGFCVIKLDSIFEKELNNKTKGEYKKKLKEEFNLTPQRKSIFKDICTFFAEDFEKTGCFELKYEFRNYTISKLTELIPVMKQSPESINKFSPKMTVKEIRNKKAELGIEKKPSSTVNFSTLCGNYSSSSTLFEKTISADNVNSETIENCINEFIEKYSQYNGNLKLMFYKCKNIEEEKE